MKNLRAARRSYETVVDGARKDLLLNDPTIGAMDELCIANNRKDFGGKKFKESEIQSVAKELEGKNLKERKQIGAHGLKLHNEGKDIGQNIQNWQPQVNVIQQQIAPQPQVPTIPGMGGMPG